MPFQTERFLALRYLRGAQGRPEGRRFLRFVTYVAIGGVAIGVAALLLAFSIVRGFSREIENKIVGFGAHVQVESIRDAPLDDATALAARLGARDGVMSVSPVVQEFILLRQSSVRIEGVSIWGTDQVPGFVARSLSQGGSELGRDADGSRRMVVGARLAQRLDVGPGDAVTAFSVRNSGDRPGRVRAKPFVVSGVFETDLADFDEVFAFVAIDEARDLVAYGPNQVTRLDLTLSSPASARSAAEAVEEAEGFPVMARSIYEVYSSLFAWVRLQQQIIPLVIAVIILVAAFNIIGTLLMLMLEKTREIGVMMAMGATPSMLRRTFLLLGALIGVSGIILGEGLALILAVLQSRYEIIPLPAEAYFMKAAPIELAAMDFLVVAVLTVLLCSISAYLPARFAGRIQPIRAIHFR